MKSQYVNYWEARLLPIQITSTHQLDMIAKIKKYHIEAFEKFEAYLAKWNLSDRDLKKHRATYGDIDLKLCKRLKTTGGTARTCINSGHALITLNFRLFHGDTTTDANLKNTYLHELAHVLTNRLYGKQCGHSAKWVTMAKILGCNGERCHDMEIPLELSSKKYTVLCPMCPKPHRVTKAKYLKIKANPNQYQCRKHKLGIIAGRLLA